jgi:hypothetical protein
LTKSGRQNRESKIFSGKRWSPDREGFLVETDANIAFHSLTHSQRKSYDFVLNFLPDHPSCCQQVIHSAVKLQTTILNSSGSFQPPSFPAYSRHNEIRPILTW